MHWADFRKKLINIQKRKIYAKNGLKNWEIRAQKLAQLDEKRLKMVIYTRNSVKKHFSKSKNHVLIEAPGHNTSLAQKKKLVYMAILLLGQNAVWTNRTSGLKNLQKTNTPLWAVKKDR